MARRTRRKKGSSNPLPLILGTVVVLAIAVLGYLFLNNGEQATAKSFPLDVYVNSSNSLRGNEYQVSGEIIKNADHDPTIGKFVFLQVDTEGEKISPDLPKSVGILVPAEVSGPNLETKQQYTFVVDVKKEGLLVANSYTAK